jgi:GTPase
MMTENTKEFRSGFVAIIGRPNVGKSTLLNRILGEKIAITSEKPQTTRNRIRGIHTVPGAQVIFIDTPGVHAARSRLNRFMVEEAAAAVQEVDAVLYLVDASVPLSPQEELLLALLRKGVAPVLLVVNKVDAAEGSRVRELLETTSAKYPFRGVHAVSAATGEGVEPLVDEVISLLPEGPCYFPDDILTDTPERVIAAEIVREKVFRLTRDEIPYSVAVEVESFTERENGTIAIAAVVTVERDSQKGIIIGKKGEMLKTIGREARLEIEGLLGTKVYLELFVRVRKDWTENQRMLKEFGYQ